MKLYDVVLRSIVPGWEQTARDGLILVFRVSDATVERLLASLPRTVKSKVDASTAGRFRDVLTSIGADVELVEHRRGSTLHDVIVPSIVPPPSIHEAHGPGPRWLDTDPFADRLPLELAADPHQRASSPPRGFSHVARSAPTSPRSIMPEPLIPAAPRASPADDQKVADLWLMSAPVKSEAAARLLAHVVGVSLAEAQQLVHTTPCLLIARGSYERLAAVIAELRAHGLDVKPRRPNSAQSLRPQSLVPGAGEARPAEVGALARLRNLLKRG